MSRHDGVSCDSCLRNDFRGKRYKCLTCPNYDLCSNCYESGVSTTRHTSDHPMQCILTRSDYEVFYGGETFELDRLYSIVCPFCGRSGLTEVTLHEHVVAEHTGRVQAVLCPICASLPDYEPNHITQNFATHLAIDHLNLREWDDPQVSMRGRRAPHPTRGISINRPRRSQMQLSTVPGVSTFSDSNRESMDPMAELLSQLSGARRAANLGQPNSNQLQQLQMQLQLERNPGIGHVNITSGIVGGRGSAPGSGSSGRIVISSSELSSGQRQSTNRAIMSRSQHPQQQQPLSFYLVAWEPPSSSDASTISNSSINQSNPSSSSSAVTNNPLTASSAAKPSTSTTLTSQNSVNTCSPPILTENEKEAQDIKRAEQSLFVQELLLNTLIEGSSINTDFEKRDEF